MSIESYIQAMSKIELHVHLEGSTRPETFLKLAKRHSIQLQAEDLDGLNSWFQFTDFGHFLEVYFKIAESLKTPDDIELIIREFLEGQASQNVRYCEVIYSPYTQYRLNGVPFDEQLDALNRGRSQGKEKFGIECQFIFDISRETSPAEGEIVAEWAISAMDQGVCALGLGGPEVGNPPEKFRAAFDLAYDAGLPAIPHAGETEGPASIRGALEWLHPVRIEHGVRALEDPDLVGVLKDLQMPLDVCPTSNICLKVFPSLESHPLAQMIAEGLNVTLNSDDPPLFSTTLTREYLNAIQVMGLTMAQLHQLVRNSINAAILSDEKKTALLAEFEQENQRLASLHLQKVAA